MSDLETYTHDKKLMKIALVIAGLVLVGGVILSCVNYTDFPTLLAGVGIALALGYVVLADIFMAFSDEMTFASDVFAASIKGFSMPGVIFELSLDGIIWLITVKLLLSILSIILSVGWFVLVLAFGTLVSAITFPFALIRFFASRQS